METDSGILRNFFFLFFFGRKASRDGKPWARDGKRAKR